MKRLYILFAALLLAGGLIVPAEASWNVRQKGNGSAVWTNGSVEVPTGNGGLIIPISSFSNAVTHYVINDKPGKIKKYYVVNHLPFPAQSGAPTINLGISNGTTAYFTPISAGSTLTMTTALFGGRASSTSPNDVNVNVSQGSVISIKVGGTSVTGSVSGQVVIIIE